MNISANNQLPKVAKIANFSADEYFLEIGYYQGVKMASFTT